MLRREVVSLRIFLRGLRERLERRASSPPREGDEALHAVRDGALRVDVERLLHEELRRVALALAEMAERELGERGRVAGLAHEHLARLRDRLVVLPRVAERRDEQRARLERAGMILHEVLELARRLLVRATATPHLGERDRDLFALGRDLRGGLRSCSSACARSPRLARTTPEIEARLPEVRIDLDGLAEERDRARLHAAGPSPPSTPSTIRCTASGFAGGSPVDGLRAGLLLAAAARDEARARRERRARAHESRVTCRPSSSGGFSGSGAGSALRVGRAGRRPSVQGAAAAWPAARARLRRGGLPTLSSAAFSPPRRGASMSGGSGDRPLRADLEAGLLERRVELRVQAAERLAHLRRPLVVDAELDRLLPAVLVRVEAALLDGDDELVDLLLVLLLVGVREPRRRRRLAERLRERLVRATNLVERRGRPLRDAERDDVEEDASTPASRSSAFCFRRPESCFTSPEIWISSKLREDALALHVARLRGGVLAVGAELALALLADVDRGLERSSAAACRRRS